MSKIKQRAYYMPCVMQNYACTMDQCRQTCCAYWDIYVDKATYQKYRSLPEQSEWRLKFEHSVKRNRNGSADYAKIIRDESLNCPFLTENQLCSLQLGLGEEYLSSVCVRYPHVDFIIDGEYWRGFELSCEGAAAPLLYEAESLQFDKILQSVDERERAGVMNPSSRDFAFKKAQHFRALQKFVISLLQNRTYELWERLTILGMFMQKLDVCVAGNIPALIQQYDGYLSSDVMKPLLADIPQRLDIHVETGSLFTNAISAWGLYQNQPQFHRMLTLCAEGLNRNADPVALKDADAKFAFERANQLLNYQFSYTGLYLPYMTAHPYILENLMVATVFNNLFPYNIDANGAFTEYRKLIVYYAIVRFFLVCITAYNGSIAKNSVVDVVSCVSRMLGLKHNSGSEQITKVMEDLGQGSLAWFTALLRD